MFTDPRVDLGRPRGEQLSFLGVAMPPNHHDPSSPDRRNSTSVCKRSCRSEQQDHILCSASFIQFLLYQLFFENQERIITVKVNHVPRAL